MSGKKGRSGRKPANTRIYHVKFRLRSGRDDDLIEFFECIPAGRRAEATKAALRGGNLAAGLDMAGATEVSNDSDLIDGLLDW
jgi:hypothetical protein